MSDSPSEGVRSPSRVRKEAQSLAMAEPHVRKARKGRFDSLMAGVLVFFLMAVAFAAAPAMNAGPTTLAGLLLLIGLTGVACLGLFTLRGAAEVVDEERAWRPPRAARCADRARSHRRSRRQSACGQRGVEIGHRPRQPVAKVRGLGLEPVCGADSSPAGRDGACRDQGRRRRARGDRLGAGRAALPGAPDRPQHRRSGRCRRRRWRS